MKATVTTIALMCSVSIVVSARAAVYTPTAQVGTFLRQFEKAYKAGDQEWIQSAVDDPGVIEEAEAIFFAFLGPKERGESISDLRVIAAPEDYELPNSLIDAEIAPTIPIDFIVVFTRKTGEIETIIKVPVGYRDGKIRIAGIKKK